jgi:hypothetical protein
LIKSQVLYRLSYGLGGTAADNRGGFARGQFALHRCQACDDSLLQSPAVEYIEISRLLVYSLTIAEDNASLRPSP